MLKRENEKLKLKFDLSENKQINFYFSERLDVLSVMSGGEEGAGGRERQQGKNLKNNSPNPFDSIFYPDQKMAKSSHLSHHTHAITLNFSQNKLKVRKFQSLSRLGSFSAINKTLEGGRG